jgi:hypothetical protein
MVLLLVVPIPCASGRLSAKFMLGGWHVAQETFILPLSRLSKKSFFPKATAFGSAEYLLEGSFGRGGKEPIHKDLRVPFSSSVHVCRSIDRTGAAEATSIIITIASNLILKDDFKQLPSSHFELL